jgi:hypothetical protein
MNEIKNPSRRTALKSISLGLASIPVVAMTRNAYAAKNDALRGALKYKDKPETVGGVEQKCSGCTHWVPGKDPKALGGCKILPGDTEINPNGHCSGWSAAAKK